MKQQTITLRGELALVVAVFINTLGVRLMLRAGAGISAISSVPYALSEVFPFLTMGTWTYLFQGVLVASLMVLRRQFVPQYLLSFVVGFFYGIMIDFQELWISLLPTPLFLRFLYFCVSYVVMCFGIAVSNRCKTPIIPTDLFPRELSQILNIPYPKVKISFDVICLIATAALTLLCLGKLLGLGIGTIVAACTMGKGIGLAGQVLDRHVAFVSVFEPGPSAASGAHGRPHA